MSKSIVAQGKTIQDAIKGALKELKVPRKRVKIEVLSEEQRGLFDMEGAKPAKIRVSLIKPKKLNEDAAYGARKRT